MEEFDIEEELENLEGKSIIEKCEALDELYDSLEEAANEVLEARDNICDKYEEACRKKFANEIKLFINTNFQGKKPDIDDRCICTFSYNGDSMSVYPSSIYGEWSVNVSLRRCEGNRKPEQKLFRKLGRNDKTSELFVPEDAVVSKMELALSFSDEY